MFWSGVVVRLPWTRRPIGPMADPPCQIYSDVPICPMDPEGVLGMVLFGTLPELSAIAGRRPGTQTNLKAQGHLRDSLARFGGWPLSASIIPLTYLYTRLHPVATGDVKVAIFADFSEGLWTPGDMRIQPSGGGGGIRTHVTVSRKHAFQACAFSHSATPPYRLARQAPAAKLIC
jgi:hypothetical protein